MCAGIYSQSTECTYTALNCHLITVREYMETASVSTCSFVRPKNIKNFLDYEIFLATHDWKLEKAEENGRSGILVTMKCKRCGSDRICVYSPKDPSPPSY